MMKRSYDLYEAPLKKVRQEQFYELVQYQLPGENLMNSYQGKKLHSFRK